jgi:hypothetical protein
MKEAEIKRTAQEMENIGSIAMFAAIRYKNTKLQ